MLPTHNTVLVVDDDQTIRDSICECLQLEGYVCWVAANADDALHRLQREETVPDVILLDLKMPGMTVEGLLAALAGNEAWSAVPVILTTAASDQEIPGDLPVRAILRRPFSVPRMLELVSRVTGTLRDGAVPDAR